MSVLISVLVVSLAGLFLLSFFIKFPKYKDINYITNAMKNPIELIHVAKHVSLFKPLQLATVLGVIFLSVKIYRWISGNGYKKHLDRVLTVRLVFKIIAKFLTIKPLLRIRLISQQRKI